jgi:hypothetical protein
VKTKRESAERQIENQRTCTGLFSSRGVERLRHLWKIRKSRSVNIHSAEHMLEEPDVLTSVRDFRIRR